MITLTDCSALIFDSDGVLVDSEIIHLDVERTLLAELGLVYSHQAYLSRFVGLCDADFLGALREDYARSFDRPFPADLLEQLDALTAPRLKAELAPIKGVKELVSVFGGPVAVASSATFKKLTLKLEIAELTSLFSPHIFSADQVAKGKPAPDLFLLAAQKLGADPQECAVIEDSVNGVRAARAAGMLAIGFTGGSHADAGLAGRLLANGAQFVASSHAEIAARF